MAESADVTCFVFVIAGDFHSAHGVHKTEMFHELIFGHGDFVVGGNVEVVHLFLFCFVWCIRILF